MLDRKGLTLMELVVVVIIISVLIAIFVPNYNQMMLQGAATSAQHNLIAIYNAQKNYYFNNNSTYCGNITNTPQTSTCYSNASLGTDQYCANSVADINCNLSLNIQDSNFSYYCTPSTGFTCVATYNSNGNFELFVTGGQNSSIVLPGGTNCTRSNVSGCNPICFSANLVIAPTPLALQVRHPSDIKVTTYCHTAGHRRHKAAPMSHFGKDL